MTLGPQPLDPRARTMWHLTAGLAAMVVVLLAGGVAGIAASNDGPVVAIGAAMVAVVAVVSAVVGPRLHYRSWRWELTDAGVELSHGVIVHVESSVPAFRVQQIDIRQGPLERAFGIVTLQITSASAGSDGTLPGIDADRADEVRRRLLARVADSDGV